MPTASEQQTLSNLLDVEAMTIVIRAMRWIGRRTGMPKPVEVQITRTIFATRVPADTSPAAGLVIAHRVMHEQLGDWIGLLE